MRGKLITAAIVWALMSGAVSAAVELCAYEAPSTDLSRLILSFYYNYLDDPDTERSDVSLGRFSLSFARTLDVARFGVSIESLNDLALDHLKLTAASGETSATVRAYASGNESLFGYAETRTVYGLGDTQLQVRLGGGYGRIVDVTPMARAIRIEKVLADYQLIADGLPDLLLFEIAELMTQLTDYPTFGELIAEIQQRIEAQTGTSLPVQVLLQIAELVVANEPEKQCGRTVQIGFGSSIDRGLVRSSLLTVTFRLAEALGLEAQLQARADLSLPLVEGASRRFSVNVRYDRRLSDTAAVVAEYGVQRAVTTDRQVSVGENLRAEVVFDVRNLALKISAALARGTPARRWTESLLITASIDLI